MSVLGGELYGRTSGVFLHHNILPMRTSCSAYYSKVVYNTEIKLIDFCIDAIFLDPLFMQQNKNIAFTPECYNW
jgi:hypothetical protein